MYEIWWKDRLLDVVERLGELPEGLNVRTRTAEREKIPPTERDWSFPKIVVFVALLFFALAAMFENVPLSEDEPSTASFARVILHTPAPVVIPKATSAIKQKVAHEIFAHAGTQSNAKSKVSSFGELWGSIGQIGRGLGSVDSLLENLGGPGTSSAVGFGTSRGSGPGLGPGLDIGDGPATRGPRVGPGLAGKHDEGPSKELTIISDGLSKDLVAKVIRAHAAEIKYCFERELQSHQSLAGKVTVSFTIGPAGEVVDSSIAESTLENESVESCMLSRVRRWKFPEPAGGGVVTVNHPWIFRGAGDNTP